MSGLEKPYSVEPSYEAVDAVDDTLIIHDRNQDDGRNWISCPGDTAVDLYKIR